MKLQKIDLANLPTKIEKLEKVSQSIGHSIYIKRDDQTGSELSGNKVRKLEYAVAEALSLGCDTLITCGGMQSNHCRATAAAAAKLGLNCIVLLCSDKTVPYEGNHFLDKLLGAEIITLSYDEYTQERDIRMQAIMDELHIEGKKGYVLPMGASNGIGTFGYYDAMSEIVTQEKSLNIVFDTIVCTVGSGGTYAGLCLGNKIHSYGKKIIGFSILDKAPFFGDKIKEISKDFYLHLGKDASLSDDDLLILDETVGLGYAKNTAEELSFIADIAQQEGVIFDPVYTGKAFKGLLDSLKKREPLFSQSKNILFIHTGGLFGLFPKASEFNF